MSRYILLLLLNMPLIIAGILSAAVSYKLGKTTKRRFIFRVVLWLLIFIGLLLSEDIYNYLFTNNLTDTEPLSLFDVVQITAIVFLFYLTTRARMRIDEIERRLHDLHQELSIKLSK